MLAIIATAKTSDGVLPGGRHDRNRGIGEELAAVGSAQDRVPGQRSEQGAPRQWRSAAAVGTPAAAGSTCGDHGEGHSRRWWPVATTESEWAPVTQVLDRPGKLLDDGWV